LFVAPPEAPASDVLDRMADEGPWYALGDGQTYEDMIFHLFACGSTLRRWRAADVNEASSVTDDGVSRSGDARTSTETRAAHGPTRP